MGVYLVTIIAILAAAIGEAVGHRFAWAALWSATVVSPSRWPLSC